MIIEYTKEMFERDKKEFIEWLEKTWTYEKHNTYFGNILHNLKNWIEESI